MLPLINLIIWTAWKVFGSPELLFEPFPRSIPLPPSLEAPRKISIPEQIHGLSYFIFEQTPKKENGRITTWISDNKSYLEYGKENASCKLTYKGDELQTFHYKSTNSKTTMERKENALKVTFFEGGQERYKKTLDLPQDAPWIQHPLIGFKKFILSEEKSTSFYSFMSEHPIAKYVPNLAKLIPLEKPPFFMKMDVKKVQKENIEGFGLLEKIEVKSSWGWPYSRFKGELWFDPQTGGLKKFFNPADQVTEVLTQNSLSPE